MTRKITSSIIFLVIALVFFGCSSTISQPPLLYFNDIDKNDEGKYRYMSITSQKGQGKEIYDYKTVQQFVYEMNNLKLVLSKDDRNVINMRKYWIQLGDIGDPSIRKYSCVISPDDKKIMINHRVFEIKSGRINFDKYLKE